MAKNIALIVAVLFSMVSAAQKTAYRSYNYAGYLFGDRDGFQLVTIHGLEANTWFIGLGGGMDTYRKESFPLFLTASKYLSASAKSFYVTVNGGTAFMMKTEMDDIPGSIRKNLQPRPFGEAGLGYRLPLKTLKAGQGLVFGAYYSYKSFREKFAFTGNCNNPPCAERYEYVDYKLSRWAVKVGFAL